MTETLGQTARQNCRTLLFSQPTARKELGLRGSIAGRQGRRAGGQSTFRAGESLLGHSHTWRGQGQAAIGFHASREESAIRNEGRQCPVFRTRLNWGPSLAFHGGCTDAPAYPAVTGWVERCLIPTPHYLGRQLHSKRPGRTILLENFSSKTKQGQRESGWPCIFVPDRDYILSMSS
jgi:hypothetical protein